MKTILLSIALFFFITGLYAQTDQGTFVLSGKTDLGFVFSKATTSTDSVVTAKAKGEQYSVSFGAGYFIANNFSLGVAGSWDYKYSDIETYGGSSHIVSSLTILPQLGYFIPVEGKLKPRIGLGVGYIWMQERDSQVSGGNNEVYNYTGVAFSGGVGVSYFFTPSFSIDLNLQYAHNRLKNSLRKEFLVKENNFGSNLGMSFYF